jgi:hypothetical protein
VISNVPATTDSVTGTVGGAYHNVTVDLRQVKVPTSGAKYPDFSYAVAAVNYTSLNDGSNDAGTGASSNHDTPVTGLVAPITVKVGKLAAGIKGVVAKTKTFAAVGAGYTVKLVSLGDVPNENSAVSGKGGTGALNNVVGTTTTDATGAFSFANIESLRAFRIDVVNADGTERGSEPVTAPADGQVKTLLIQRGGLAVPVADGAVPPADDTADLRTVFVSTTDTLAPTLLSVSPETGFDVPAATGSVDVKFTFSEPIKATPYAKALTAASIGAAGGLYSDVLVNFNGAKAGNIPHSLAWNAAMTELTVTIPNVAKASRYSVDITATGGGIAAGKLMDVNNVPFAVPTANATVNFSTNGAVTPAAVTTLTVTNRATLNAAGVPTVDWLPVASAKSYNVYRATSVSGSPFSDFQRIANTRSSDYQDVVGTAAIPATATTPATPAQGQNDTGVILADYTAPAFVLGDLKVAYKYKVRPVSYDNTELDASTDVADNTENAIAQDKMSPTVMLFTGVTAGSTTVTVRFAEQMDEASAETVTNYVLTARADDPLTGTTAFPINEAPTTAPIIAAPTPSLAVYERSNNTVTLTFASGIPAGTTLTVTGIKDVAGNVMTAKGNPADVVATNAASVDKVTIASAFVSNVSATTTTTGTTTTTTTTTTVVVNFTADVDAADAILAAKYALSAPATTPVVANATVTSVAVTAGNKRQVTLTLNGALNPSTTLTVTGVKGLFGTFADGTDTLN